MDDVHTEGYGWWMPCTCQSLCMLLTQYYLQRCLACFLFLLPRRLWSTLLQVPHPDTLGVDSWDAWPICSCGKWIICFYPSLWHLSSIAHSPNLAELYQPLFMQVSWMDHGCWVIYIPYALHVLVLVLTMLNPRRHGGVDATPPCGFSGISFLLTVRLSPFFSIAFRPSFLRPPWKFQDPDPPNIWPMTS